MDDYHLFKGQKNGYKSSAEVQLARFFDREGIKYFYEYPHAVRDGDKIRLLYPDFRLPQFGLIVEYFGVNGDPNYNSCMEKKMKAYRESGIDGLFLTKDSFKGDWPTKILKGIEYKLKAGLDNFYHRKIHRT